jgi:hypothetical protein
MKKRPLNDLKYSLILEEEKVKDKFDKAELYLKQDKELNEQTAIPLRGENELVREGISLLQQEATIIENIRAEVTAPGFYPTKSEIFRAGILALAELPKDKLIQVLSTLPKLKPGRKKP